MKTPDRATCPCCEVELKTVGFDRTVEPDCYQAHNERGEVLHCVLQWRCRVCGCKWLHEEIAVTPAVREITPPQLADAMVVCNIVPPEAVQDAEGYDGERTLGNIRALFNYIWGAE